MNLSRVKWRDPCLRRLPTPRNSQVLQHRMANGLRQVGDGLGHIVCRIEGMESAALLPGKRQQQRVVEGIINAETMHRKIRGRFHKLENRRLITDLRVSD